MVALNTTRVYPCYVVIRIIASGMEAIRVVLIGRHSLRKLLTLLNSKLGCFSFRKVYMTVLQRIWYPCTLNLGKPAETGLHSSDLALKRSQIFTANRH